MNGTVWLALRPVDPAPQAAPDWLSASERQRFASIRAPHRLAQFIAGRRLARQLLATTHGGNALCDWALSSADDRPPRVERAPVGVPAGLVVALSHSSDCVACAVAAFPVGLDIEVPRGRRNLQRLAEAVCSVAERERLGALPDALKGHYLYVLWTLKEAWFKRLGQGLDPGRLPYIHAEPCSPMGNGWSWRGLGAVLSLIANPGSDVRWVDTDIGARLGMPDRWELHSYPSSSPDGCAAARREVCLLRGGGAW